MVGAGGVIVLDTRALFAVYENRSSNILVNGIHDLAQSGRIFFHATCWKELKDLSPDAYAFLKEIDGLVKNARINTPDEVFAIAQTLQDDPCGSKIKEDQDIWTLAVAMYKEASLVIEGTDRKVRRVLEAADSKNVQTMNLAQFITSLS